MSVHEPGSARDILRPAAAALAATFFLASCGTSDDTQARASQSPSANQGTETPGSPQRECAKGAGPLPGDAIGDAADAAYREAPDQYGEIDTSKRRVEGAVRATFDRDRGPIVKKKCSRKTWQRTVVVYLTFPRMPGASSSQAVVFVARFADGYHIWYRAH